MPKDERQAWNQRYREGSHANFTPDAFLVSAYEEYVHPLFPGAGTALDVAGGLGRHAMWLGRRGWRVTVVDISEVAAQKALAKAGRGHVQLDFLVRDLTTYRLEPESFDLILVFFYLQRELFPALIRALKPGGVLLYKTYTKEHRKFAKGPSNPMYFLDRDELLDAFRDLDVLYYRETVQEKGVAELVARKTGLKP